MKRSEFRELASRKIIQLDGATGTELMKRGMPVDACMEQWVLERPGVLLGLQREYVAAGANVIVAGSAVFKAEDRRAMIAKLKA